jgi:pyruvate/2-oxoglutarate dehydrogenase complex dihydrolipoamide dehydrogenase (E3) component
MPELLDVLILGSGQAGVPLATRLAATGRSVALVERGDLGGTCVNVGCTPTKTMIASARAAQVARTAARLGVRAGNVEIDLAAVVDRKDAIVGRWREGVARRIEGAAPRLRLVRGHARFTGDREVQVGAERLRAAIVVVNVGARPAIPKIPGLAEVPYLTNESAMRLRDLPGHLLVMGGGYIGCEFGQMFRRFGARVTVADPNERLLSREDPDVTAPLEEAFRDEGIALELGARVEQVSGGPDRIVLRLAGGRELAGTHLLVATGRLPNTDDLGCDRAGIALDSRGFLAVDDFYRTSAEGVYGVGDVAGGPQFTHSSWDDHRILFELLAGRTGRTRADRLVPHVVFTDPPVAVVGITETEARSRGLTYETASMPWGHIARAIEVDETRGMLKVLVDPASERILGAALVGSEAGELIHVFAALISARAGARALVDAEMVHPTFAEGLQSVLMKLPRFALS